MSSQPYIQLIFINLPVSSLEKAITFYTAVGFVQNHSFSDESTAMMSLYNPPPSSSPTTTPDTNTSSPPINLMLLTQSRFQGFLPKDRSICDAKTSVQALLCLSSESREKLDETFEIVKSEGGEVDVAEKQDHGWMYGRSFADLDGHVWEIVWMDAEKAKEAGKEGKAAEA